MNIQEYQSAAERTLIYKPDISLSDRDFMLVWVALGLCGESGEFGDYIKKGVLHQHGLDIDKVKEELGDVCWYIASLCSLLDLSLDEVMKKNIDKLLKRYPNGYSHQDSVSRR